MDKIQLRSWGFVIIVLLLGLLLTETAIGSVQTNDTINLVRGLVTSGGSSSSNNYYHLEGIVGQPTVGTSTNSSHHLRFGFWSQVSALRSDKPEIEFRSIDGSDNNLNNPHWGRVDEKLLRLAGSTYADGYSAPPIGPNPRAVSNDVAAQSNPIFNALGVSDLFWQWGQFVDHDLGLTEPIEPHESFPITVPAGDPLFNPAGIIDFNRSIYDLTTGTTNPREQINQITAFMDASQVYASSTERAIWKRVVLSSNEVGADLQMSANNLLPYEPDGTCGGTNPCFRAGDIRANEQPGLTAMHTLLMREHNRIVARLRVAYPDWDEDRLYETTRLIVGSELQRITYNEWLPMLLGPNALPAYSGYDSSVNSGIANEFSTACFRFGHTMLSGTLLRLDADGNQLAGGHIPLRDGFFNTSYILADGIDPIVRGLIAQRAQALDTQLVDDVRNFLFGPVGAGGFDLAALNIQRGRDHGLASYNDMRAALGLGRATTFADITSDSALQAKLALAYGSVDKVDLWIGGLAEDAVNGGLLGATCSAVIADQLTRLRDGDRFWNANLDWTVYGLASDPVLHSNNTTLGSLTLKQLIEWNSGVENVPNNPFIAPDALYVYAISADNPPSHPANLTPLVIPALKAIREATINAPEKTAIVLIDRSSHNDTTILEIRNGQSTDISGLAGLPNESGVLTNNLLEYDMTDGKQLGGFLRWALQTYATENTVTYFDYIGHGTAVAPDVNYPIHPVNPARHTDSIIPLPYSVGINPAYTDIHPQPSLITPHDLQVALEIGTDNGETPFDIVDLSHCFSATIEELVELNNPDGERYAEIFIGSPNYTYFAPEQQGASITTIAASQDASTNATQLLNSYDSTLATYEDGSVTHPGIWVAVEGTAIAAIKDAIDSLSVALLNKFDVDPNNTQQLLQTAYDTAGAYYDTPLVINEAGECVADWALTNEDQLIDVKAFMLALATQFSADSTIRTRATATATAIDNAILHKVTRNGTPWFATNPTNWTFDEPQRGGIGMLGALAEQQNSMGMYLLPFSSTYYTSTRSVHAQDDNPNPFVFVQSDSASWADVLTRYWQTRSVSLGTTVCLPEIQVIQQEGELHVARIVEPFDGSAEQHKATPLSVRISAEPELYFVDVLFEVLDANNDIVFTHTQGVGRISTNLMTVQADKLWTPSLEPGEAFRVRVTVDPDFNVIETNLNDNRLVLDGAIVDENTHHISATIPAGQQFFADRTIPLTVSTDWANPSEITAISVQLRTYEPNLTNPNARDTRTVAELLLSDLTDWPNLSFELPDNMPPGAVQAHVWAWRGSQRSNNVANLQFNYAPVGHRLDTGDMVEYMYQATEGEILTFNIQQLSGYITSFVQTPTMFVSATMLPGSSNFSYHSAQEGTYIVRIVGESAESAYTLTVTRNGQPARAVTNSPVMVEMQRPEFVDPVPQKPTPPPPPPTWRVFIPV
ncbi:MAG: peroxidase family protein, partial [Candidatus Promineifilaceae bacterium]